MTYHNVHGETHQDHRLTRPDRREEKKSLAAHLAVEAVMESRSVIEHTQSMRLRGFGNGV